MQKTFNFFYALLLAVLGLGATLMAEEITLVTYYPAPYGAYDELTTTGKTCLATGAPGNQVGLGTTSPTATYKLDVVGTVNATGYDVSGDTGATGSFTTTDGKTVTVTNGIITNII